MKLLPPRSESFFIRQWFILMPSNWSITKIHKQHFNRIQTHPWKLGWMFSNRHQWHTVAFQLHANLQRRHAHRRIFEGLQNFPAIPAEGGRRRRRRRRARTCRRYLSAPATSSTRGLGTAACTHRRQSGWVTMHVPTILMSVTVSFCNVIQSWALSVFCLNFFQ